MRPQGEIEAEWIIRKVWGELGFAESVEELELSRNPVQEESLAEADYTPDELDHAIGGYGLALAKSSNKQALENLKSIVNPSLKQRLEHQAAFVESE